MATYKKYALLYYFHKPDVTAKHYIRLIYLGSLKNPKPVPMLEGVYAYKILSSKLDLTELSKDFFTSEENNNSVRLFIGNEYKVDDYLKLHPDFAIEHLEGNLSSYKIAETFPLGITFTTTFSVFTHTRVVTRDYADNETTLITLSELLENYESVLLD